EALDAQPAASRGQPPALARDRSAQLDLEVVLELPPADIRAAAVCTLAERDLAAEAPFIAEPGFIRRLLRRVEGRRRGADRGRRTGAQRQDGKRENRAQSADPDPIGMKI